MESRIVDCVDEIDSFDAYYSNVYLGKEILIIPYINLGLSQHPLNPGDRLKYLDFAYLVCIGLRYLRVKKGVLLSQKEYAGPLLYFGGFNMDEPPDHIDFEIGCEFAYLQPLSDTKMSDTNWVPVESPKRNLAGATVEAFIRGERMPESIRHLMG